MVNKICIRRRFGSFLASLLVSSACYAQFSGNIQGVIEDPSGAVVSKAKVTLQNIATEVTQEATSDDKGEYKFASLAPGSYKLTATAAGFASAELRHA